MANLRRPRPIRLDRQTADYRISGYRWVLDARCRRYDEQYADAVFFPSGGSAHKESSAQRRREAVRCCLLCPVRLDCLSQVLRLERDSAVVEAFGVWGGTTMEDRALTRDLPAGERFHVLDEMVRAKASTVLAPWETPTA